MATNPYSYGSLGARWTVGEPTSKSLLDISRVKNDANRWTLEQLITDPDTTQTLGFDLSFNSSEQRLLQIYNTDASNYFQIYGGRAGSPTSDHLVFSTGTNGTIMEFDGANHWITFHDTAGVQKMYYRGSGGAALILESGVDLIVGGTISGTTGTFSGRLAVTSTASTYEGMELITPSGDGSGVFQFGVHDSGGSAGRSIEFRRGGSDGFDTLSARINADGNFSVGGDAVANGTGSAVLNVNATTGGSTIHLTNNTTGTTNSDGALFVQSGSDLLLINRESGNLKLRTADTDRVTILSDGKAGIGTASPDALIHVSQGGSYPTMTANTHAIVGNTSSGSAISRAAIMAGATTGFSVLDFGDTDASNAGGITYSHQYDRLNLCAGAGATRASIDSDGLKFGTDTAAANALDDYEEGTWTPTIIATTTNPTVGYSVQYGRYTKVGNIVTVQMKIDLSSFSGGSGSILIANLPFTSNSDANYRSAGITSFTRSITNGGGAITLNIAYNDTRAFLVKYTNADNYDTNVAPSDLASNSIIHATMTYEAQ